jgi:uncharacterized protein YndB with AHSA1/START domain
MPQFSLTTTWLIPAPVEAVWSCLIDSKTWPYWWKYLDAVEEMTDGDTSGINNIRRYYWRTSLPYTLMLDLRVTQIQAPHLIAVEVKGDFHGNGICRLSSIPAADHTRVEFNWDVQTCKPWMNWFTPVTRPVFAWNHARVMRLGEQGLIQYFNSRLTNNTE